MQKRFGPALKYAFRQSLPVMFGYIFLGVAFGILLQQAGFGALWALLISGFVYAGSLQFVLVGFLAQGAALPTVAALADAVLGTVAAKVPGLPVEYTVLLLPMVLVWYILTELGSILENAAAMGAPVPEFLIRILANAKDTVEDAAGEA